MWKENLLFLVCLVKICFIKATCNIENECVGGNGECPNKDITFWFYTNETQSSPVQLDPLDLRAELFSPHLPLKILFHGYSGNKDTSVNNDIRPVLFQKEAVHIISVDYSPLGIFEKYYMCANIIAKALGKCVAQLVDNLIYEGGYDREQIHLIGSSLGAQAAGLTANYVQNKLSHITGLDPAALTFKTTDLKEKLDPTDADFVDVIHTDEYYRSFIEAVGHVDFYANFKLLSQPGCLLEENGQYSLCSHRRASIYYGESITSEKQFLASYCNTWLDFQHNRCKFYTQKENAVMGYYVSKNATGSYFLTTNSKSPFAKGTAGLL